MTVPSWSEFPKSTAPLIGLEYRSTSRRWDVTMEALTQPGDVARGSFLLSSEGLSTREFPPDATSFQDLGATLHWVPRSRALQGDQRLLSPVQRITFAHALQSVAVPRALAPPLMVAFRPRLRPPLSGPSFEAASRTHDQARLPPRVPMHEPLSRWLSQLREWVRCRRWFRWG